ncbi:MAG: hypothetical protein FWG39_03075 [Alphaproteobacteria bacterium]|nr:hypothetical protein [Alphaproteobacteria bacterium]
MKFINDIERTAAGIKEVSKDYPNLPGGADKIPLDATGEKLQKYATNMQVAYGIGMTAGAGFLASLGYIAFNWYVQHMGDISFAVNAEYLEELGRFLAAEHNLDINSVGLAVQQFNEGALQAIKPIANFAFSVVDTITFGSGGITLAAIIAYEVFENKAKEILDKIKPYGETFRLYGELKKIGKKDIADELMRKTK